MHPFTIVFLIALLLATLTRYWLAARQIRHVKAHRAAVPEAFRDTIELGEHHKAADYTVAKVRSGVVDMLAGSALLLFWTLGGGLNLVDGLWADAGFSAVITGVVVMLSAFLFMGLLDLPFSIYDTFVLEQRFGFNRTTATQFIRDLVLQTAITGVLGGALAWVILTLMTSAGDNWWIAAWVVWSGFMILMSWAYPTFIAPLFNEFRNLEDRALEERIQRLVDRCGFVARGIFVMDGSRRSGHGNAYFTGLGRSKRIVFFDTLLESLDGEEVEAVLAHELGHFKRHHVTQRLVISLVMSLAGLALLGWLAQQSWFYSALGVESASPHMALLLFMLVIPVFMTFLQPVSSLYMRRHEFQADDYAAQQTNAENLIHALVKLYKENASTLTPDPLYSAFHDSHPPAPVRIAHLRSRTGLAEGA